MSITIQSSVKDNILATSSETSKVENALAEMLRDLDQQMEKRADDGCTLWIKLYSKYGYEIRYHPGKANVVIEALSRKERVKPRRDRVMAMTIQYGEWNSGDDQLRFRWMIYFVVLADAAESVSDAIRFEYCLASSSGWTKSPVLWAEIGESSLIGPELVQETTDKVVLIKEKLKAARDRQKSYADNRRKPLEFEVGDRVMLKVSPWKGVIRFGKKGKLAPRYVGPFEILERVGPVAYRLRLPEELSGVHDTFHVSNLKKCLADASLHVPLDEIKVDKTLRFVEEPVENSDCEVMRLKCSRMVIVKVRFWLEARSLRLQIIREVFVKLLLDSFGKLSISYAFSVSLLLTPLSCDDIHDVTPRVFALAGCDTKYAVGGKITTIQDYALWEVIENGDSWVSVSQTLRCMGNRFTMDVYTSNIQFSNPDAKSMFCCHWKQDFEAFRRLVSRLCYLSSISLLASVSDNTVYAFMVENPNGSNVLHQDLEQIHEDDLDAMDLKWQLSLLSVRAKKYYHEDRKKIFHHGECRAPRSKEGQFRNQDNTRKQGNNEDTSKAMLAIDGVVVLDTVEAQLVTYRKNEVLFSEEVDVLKREVGVKQYEINMLRTEFEKVKQEKDAIDFKIEKFGKASKDLDQLLGSQITDKSKKGFGYSAVPPPHPLIYNRPNKLDLSYSGLDEFKEPEFKGYGPKNNKKESNVVKSSFVEGCGSNTSKSVSEVEPKKVRKNNDAPIIKDWVSDDEEQDESKTKPEKKTVIPTAAKIEKPVKKSVRYAEMYRSQSPRGNQRSWNGQSPIN
ncbi:hypothetical protein Tco_0410320 [Tanacetum coccineum]